jgi:hypothetical protein
MSILRKEDKIQPMIIDDMFEVNVSCLFDTFDGLRDKIKQTYSKDILSLIRDIDTCKCYDFGKVGTLQVKFSTSGIFRAVYRGDILDRLEWKIKVSASNGELAINRDDHYMIHIHIKTDEAREFISDLIDEIDNKILNR